MTKNLPLTVYASASDVATHCSLSPEFMAEILNFIGVMGAPAGFNWQRAFAAALANNGETALRAMVARLDAIDATSTEG